MILERKIRDGVFTAAALMLAVTVTACSSGRRGEPIAGPMDLSDASVRRGRDVFDVHCYKCHLQGDGGMSPIINNKPLPKFLMSFQIRHGMGAMPAFSEREISASELEDLLNYLVALRHHGTNSKSAGPAESNPQS